MNDTERIKKTFAKNLRFYMDDYGLNQSDISKIADVSKQSVSYWLNEKLLPRMGTIEKLADHFHILKSDLLEEKDKVSLNYKNSFSIDFDNIDKKTNYELQDLIKDGVYEQYCNDPSKVEEWINNTKEETDKYIYHLENLICFMSYLRIPMSSTYTDEIENANNLINTLKDLKCDLEDLLFYLESLHAQYGESASFVKYDTPEKKRKYLEATQDYDFSDKTDDEIITLYKFFREQEKKKNELFKESITKKD